MSARFQEVKKCQKESKRGQEDKRDKQEIYILSKRSREDTSGKVKSAECSKGQQEIKIGKQEIKRGQREDKKGQQDVKVVSKGSIKVRMVKKRSVRD
jgi:hypothetical protein